MWRFSLIETMFLQKIADRGKFSDKQKWWRDQIGIGMPFERIRRVVQCGKNCHFYFLEKGIFDKNKGGFRPHHLRIVKYQNLAQSSGLNWNFLFLNPPLRNIYLPQKFIYKNIDITVKRGRKLDILYLEIQKNSA